MVYLLLLRCERMKKRSLEEKIGLLFVFLLIVFLAPFAIVYELFTTKK